MNLICILLFYLIPIGLVAQETIPIDNDNWDNNMNVSNKFSFGLNNWKHSAEFQTRFKDNLGGLDQWYVEYSATYLAAKNWELVPDFRFTKKPTRVEYRPGLGGIYKQLYEKSQLVHQVKWQYDFKNGQNDSQGLRYVIFYNYIFSENFVVTGLAGGLFEFGEDFNGFLGVRTGLSAAYVFNKAHSINLGYFYGYVNDRSNNFTNIGIVSIQLIINLNVDYKYLPAKYFSL